MSNSHKTVIIGSGPAGYTAAIYAARANLAPVMLEGLQPGGQLTITTDVENYPGFPDGVMGPEMMEMFKRQAARFGTDIRPGLATRVNLKVYPFEVQHDGGELLLADSVIVATGASAKWIGLPAEQRLMGRGVSGCATCDGFFFRDQDILVVGGGDTAMEEATFLTRFGKQVYVVHRRDTLRASKAMQDRALANPKIKFIWNTAVEEILGEQKVEAVRLRNLVDNTVKDTPINAVFVAIGHKPNTELFAGQLTFNEAGYIVTKPGTSLTNIEGVFACGDAQDWVYRQAVTAAGTGCIAAIDCERWLEARGH